MLSINNKEQLFYNAWDIAADYWLTPASLQGVIRLDASLAAIYLTVPNAALFDELRTLTASANHVVISHCLQSECVQITFEGNCLKQPSLCITHFAKKTLPQTSDPETETPQWPFLVCFEDGALYDNIAHYKTLNSLDQSAISEEVKRPRPHK